jgi:hypothetical protein
VEYDEASAYAEENSLLFMETSAKERTKPELILQQKPPVARKKYLKFNLQEASNFLKRKNIPVSS